MGFKLTVLCQQLFHTLFWLELCFARNINIIRPVKVLALPIVESQRSARTQSGLIPKPSIVAALHLSHRRWLILLVLSKAWRVVCDFVNIAVIATVNLLLQRRIKIFHLHSRMHVWSGTDSSNVIQLVRVLGTRPIVTTIQYWSRPMRSILIWIHLAILYFIFKFIFI